MNDKAKGFSLVELIVVVALIGIITAIATPSFMDWRRNVEYRAAARDIVSMMREAKARAISTNREHRVEFDVDGRRYRLVQGSRAADTPVAGWTTIIREYVSLPEGVNMKSTVNCDSSADGNIEFNPNGTAGGSIEYVCVMDSNNVRKYRVGISSTTTGRVVTTR